ncbi:hypothetical protein V5O48_009342 [Marasmius crinis-equi]|uniref:Uncharacterized protein n=1 Tax=Marasmius crinis-equi TaxID=585013 RepID=A0ABR3FBC9_9AGAR
MEFLWVRWFGTEPDYRSGSKTAKLPKIGYVPDDDELAFGFLDPEVVIRGCHLVPDFAGGKTDELLRANNSVARPPGVTEDWQNFYVMIFADRDMWMRYWGGGIGHTAPRHASSDDSNVEADDPDSEDEDSAYQKPNDIDPQLEDTVVDNGDDRDEEDGDHDLDDSDDELDGDVDIDDEEIDYGDDLGPDDGDVDAEDCEYE